MIVDNHAERTEVMVMFRILTRKEWDQLQAWHASCSGSTIEHLYAGLYVLTISAGGVWEMAA